MDIFKRKTADSTKEDLRSDIAAELAVLQNRLKEQNAHLQKGDSQLHTIRAEYDQIVSNLMKIKREINDKKEEQVRLEHLNKGIRMQIEDGRRILRGSYKDFEMARRTAADLERLTAELEEKRLLCNKTNVEVERVQGRLTEMGVEMEQLQKKRQDMDSSLQQNLSSELAEYKSRLASSEDQRNQMAEQMNALTQMVTNLKQRLASSEARLQERSTQNPDKGVVEAASALVASFRIKLTTLQEELADAKSQLDKERARRANG